jgi:hypothetical protein
MIRFKADNTALAQIIQVIINRSKPFGAGMNDYEIKLYGINEIKEILNKQLSFRNDIISFDYFRGRMVKIILKRIDEDIWETGDQLEWEYQSWAEQSWHSWEQFLTEMQKSTAVLVLGKIEIAEGDDNE